MAIKPVVSAFNAWSCILISICAIFILSAVGGMFKAGNHGVMGSEEDPKDKDAVAGAIFFAVIVYIVFLVFCASQALLHSRASRRGAIALN